SALASTLRWSLSLRYASIQLQPSSTHFIFFFQAEDGIRDRNVTGVQTCALPILKGALFRFVDRIDGSLHTAMIFVINGIHLGPRSEERRVGKECRSRSRLEQEGMKMEGWGGSEVDEGTSTVLGREWGVTCGANGT